MLSGNNNIREIRLPDFSEIKKIGLAKEVQSPENPEALEKRVALVPKDVAVLVKRGLKVSVEKGAGEGIGFSDSDYKKAGAVIETHKELYSSKDLIIKFKGPALDSIPLMAPGTTLFCMAHFLSFPERAKLLKEHKINVVAMEHVYEMPKFISDELIYGKVGMQRFLDGLSPNMKRCNIFFIGYSEVVAGAIRRASNRFPKMLRLGNEDSVFGIELSSEIEKNIHDTNILIWDSGAVRNADKVGLRLKEMERSSSLIVNDLRQFKNISPEICHIYRQTHPPHQFGLRRIQCLHETGMAGARYGLKLLKEKSPKKLDSAKARVVVLGYGNVGMGAIHECYNQGVKSLLILGKNHTQKGVAEKFFASADLIINGAEQPEEMRGKNFLVSKEQTSKYLEKGSVVIDLVGGSETNRSPVEQVLKCTFLNDPYFVENEIYFSALWGWPMMGMMKETAVKYSGQIIDVLLERERLIDGLSHPHEAIQNALVCGPFSQDS